MTYLNQKYLFLLKPNKFFREFSKNFVDNLFYYELNPKKKKANKTSNITSNRSPVSRKRVNFFFIFILFLKFQVWAFLQQFKRKIKKKGRRKGK